ncbi:hypothetical protein AGABI2DRAFT_71516, partial [Agaricus bisporus var. bisporus H97]|uniref:hypothetical protein n=1 Tax=Agaricus bisporus var. bisporus (strain H97 / ATCC MYA-4626 / FGSC 10389) TaxID=936046 RepID=UPI00029F7B26
HRLFKPDDSNEEWTARIRGLVCLKELPPYPNVRTRNNNARMHIKQGIGLTGLGLEEFDRQIDAIRAIFATFAPLLPAPCKPLTERVFEEFSAIHCSTRMFTHRKHADGQKDIPFTSAEDPYNVLQKIKGDDFIHGEDNCVEYRNALLEDSHITGYVDVIILVAPLL